MLWSAVSNMKPERRLKGRPPKGVSVEGRRNYTLTVPNSSFSVWERQAQNSGLTMSAWISEILAQVISGKIRVPFGDPEIPRGRSADFRFKLNFSVRRSEVEAWTKFAEKSGLSVAEFIRQSLDFVAGDLVTGNAAGVRGALQAP